MLFALLDFPTEKRDVLEPLLELRDRDRFIPVKSLRELVAGDIELQLPGLRDCECGVLQLPGHDRQRAFRGFGFQLLPAV